MATAPTIKQGISTCVIGHVDAGKSSLCGRLLVDSGAISTRVMDKLKKEAAAMGKESFGLAHATDNNPEERKRGITINTTTKQFVTPNGRVVTMVDSPGHRDFINNMISGAAQCNAAILVISAVPTEFRAGIHPTGQTYEHAFLVHALGVKNIIVAVNKMDSVNWEEKAYREIVEEASSKFKKLGINAQFCPISGFHGLNITSVYPEIKSWFNKPTDKCLMEMIEDWPEIVHDLTLPLRMSVSGGLKVEGSGQIYTGKIYTGKLKVGDKIEIEPTTTCEAEVKSIQKFHQSYSEAFPDDNVGIALKALKPANAIIKKGDIIGAKGSGVVKVKRFEGLLMMIENVGGSKAKASSIGVGFKPVVACHTAKIASTIVGISSIMVRNKVTKKMENVIEERQTVCKGDRFTADLQPEDGRLVIMNDPKFGILTRFVLRNSNKTIALGVCKKIKNDEFNSNFLAPKKANAKIEKEAAKKKK